MTKFRVFAIVKKNNQINKYKNIYKCLREMENKEKNRGRPDVEMSDQVDPATAPPPPPTLR